MRAVFARGLVQSFGQRSVLDGLDLNVEAGERVALLGANGAGKTTLLRILATLSRPQAGELQLFGADPRRARGKTRARIGYAGHQPGFYPELTAEENLAFFGVAYGVPRPRAIELLGAVGLGAARREPTGRFSRGMLQRLAIARSLLQDPELWILDEPDASLDEDGRSLLGMLAGRRTVVFSTHDRSFAEALGGRCLTLSQGRLEGAPNRLELAL